MTENEQYRFVRELTDSITRKVLADIERGNIPEAWDGHELRQLLADRYEHAVFKNVVIVNNL